MFATIATVYFAGWIATAVALVPSFNLTKQSPHCSDAEYSYPVVPRLDVSWLSYCQQVYGDVLLETSLDDGSSIIDNTFIAHDSDPLLTSTDKESTTTAIADSSTSNDGVVVPLDDKTNITTSSADSRRSSSISDMSDYIRLARISQSTRQHVNLYYESTTVQILPLDWALNSKISDTKRKVSLPSAVKVYPKHYQWVEVSRVPTGWWNEGYSIGLPKNVHHNLTMVPYGCWFHHAKGSGIFVNLGYSLLLPDKQERTFSKLDLKWNDKYLCTVALARGYDSIQIEDNAEIIICRGGCATTTYNGTCPPLELRTGYNASRVCNCSEDMTVLNCGVNIHTGMAAEKHLKTKASSSSSSKTNSYRQRPFSCISQKNDPQSSLSFKLLLMFSSGLTSYSESAQFIISAINKSVEAQYAVSNEHEHDDVSNEQDTAMSTDRNSKTNIDESSNTSHKQNDKTTSKVDQQQQPLIAPPPHTRQYSLFIDYYRTEGNIKNSDVINIQHVKGFTNQKHSKLDHPYSSSSASASLSASSSDLFSVLPHRRNLDSLLLGSVNSLLVKDRMGVLFIGVVRFRYPKALLLLGDNSTSPTVSSSLDEDMRTLKRQLIDECSCLRIAGARLIIAVEDIAKSKRPQHISILKFMRLYIAHHLLGYLDLMLVYDAVSKNSTNEDTVSKNSTNEDTASKNSTNGGFESSYCYNQWYMVNSSPFSSNSSSFLLPNAAAAMMFPLAGIDLGSHNYGVVSLHYTASDQRMATKNWEPQSLTKLVERAVYRFNDSKIMYIAEKGVLRAIPDMTTFGGLQLDLDRIVLIPQSRKDYYVIGQPYLSTDLIDKLDSHTHKVKQQHKPQKSITP